MSSTTSTFSKKTVCRWDPVTNIIEKTDVPRESVGAVVLTDKGNILAASEHCFALIDWKSKAFKAIKDVESTTKPQNRFNDGKCDPAGRFWAGTMGIEDGNAATPGQGSLYCLHQDKSVTTHADGIYIANGLSWSSCGKFMYYIDSPTKRVDVFDFDMKTGNTSNRRIAVDTSNEGIPDGMCIDEEDMIWVAMWGGWKVIRYNPRTGEKISELKFPSSQITSCCWGGPELDVLYVTSAKKTLTQEQLQSQPTAGSIYTVKGLGVKGIKSEEFKE